MKTERGSICESRFYRGQHAGTRCFHPATGYQFQNDIYLCGIHARGYLRVEPIALTGGHPR